MATIKETLDEIPKIQKGLSKEVEGKTLDAKFLNDINNFLSLYYLDLLAHACMASLKGRIEQGEFPSAFIVYRKISKQEGALQELIRYHHIGGLFSIWVKFEQFVFRHVPTTGKIAGDFQKSHRSFMEKQKIKRKHIKELEKTFTGIRRTRNSLHSDGIYHNEEGKSYSFTLLGEKYLLEHKRPVAPLRLLSVIRFLIDHYYELHSANKSC